jgi:tetratricopeptide (TPR) repeat protein
MKAFGPGRPSMASVGTAAIGGAVGLAAILVGIEATRGAATPPDAPVAAAIDAGFPICHTAGRPLVLAAAKTEVPGAELRAATPAPEFADRPPPLYDGLGALSYGITTASPEAQAYFDQGLRLAYAFNHAEAQRAFRKAQALDPDCAMCFWGEALVLGPNINLPMQPEAVAPALAAAARASGLAGRASAREQALIAALATRYAGGAAADRAALDAAYAAAMGAAAARFPEDDEIAVLYAEALMDLSPWNYWQPGGHEPNPESAAIVPTLERVLARNPGHPGAAHFYIHAVEASDRPERAEPYADRLRGAMPAAGHLVHMPSHIYYRVGRYLDALADNKTAVAVDEKYLAETGAPMGVYRLGYYPHNVHFVMVSAQMAGDGPTVIASAEKLRGLIPDAIAAAIAMVQPVKAAPYFAHAQFSTPEAILSLSDPGDAVPYVKATWHYARGIAHAMRHEPAAAAAEAEAIAAIERTADFSLLKQSGVPAETVMRLARAVIAGRIAQAEGDFPAAVERFREAAALQDELPYMEPPYWYYPVRQSLAATLLQAGRLDEAEQEFRLALKRAPANGWSYFGLAALYQARGDAAAMQKAESDLEKTWVGDRSLLQLSRL